MKNYKQIFINNLKAMMKEKNLTQAKIAEEMNVDQTTISKWLCGISEPTLTKICLLVKILNCSYDDLFFELE